MQQRTSRISLSKQPRTAKNDIRIAIQRSGRLSQPSLSFLGSLGFEFTEQGLPLIKECLNYGLSMVLVRDDDIPRLVENGSVDFGIVGQNVLLEKGTSVGVIKQLGFGQCRLDIASPDTSKIRKPEDLENARIATAYPRLLRRYLAEKNITASIVEITGSAEIAPALGFADAIGDIVQTGKTLRAHGLSPIATVCTSEAVLIEGPRRKKDTQWFVDMVKSV